MESESKSKSVNKLAVIGTVVNAVLVLLTTMGADQSELPLALRAILLIFLFINITGLIVSTLSDGKSGPILVIVGSIAFIPVGVISLFGARKMLDDIKRRELEPEREQQ